MSTLRLRYGLHWPTKRPAFPWCDLAIVVACLLAYGLVAEVDRLGDRAALMEQLDDQRGAYQQVMTDCMSGANGFHLPDTKQAFECRINPL